MFIKKLNILNLFCLLFIFSMVLLDFFLVGVNEFVVVVVVVLVNVDKFGLLEGGNMDKLFLGCKFRWVVILNVFIIVLGFVVGLFLWLEIDCDVGYLLVKWNVFEGIFEGVEWWYFLVLVLCLLYNLLLV